MTIARRAPVYLPLRRWRQHAFYDAAHEDEHCVTLLPTLRFAGYLAGPGATSAPDFVALPVLGVVVAGATPPGVLALLARARRWCLPRPVSPSGAVEPAPSAFLACSLEALWLLSSDAAPTAVYLDDAGDLSDPATDRASVVLSSSAQVLSAAGSRGLAVPVGELPPDARPVSPFVRARLRQARGLPERPVVIAEAGAPWRWSGGDLATDDACFDTALAVCASAVVVGPALAQALAWATPVVTDAASAESVGALAGAEVLVGDAAGDRVAMALALASDDAEAARVGWRGRLLAERRFDTGRAGAALVSRLGLDRFPAAPPASVVESRLAELGTPGPALNRARAADAIAPLRAPMGKDGRRGAA